MIRPVPTRAARVAVLVASVAAALALAGCGDDGPSPPVAASGVAPGATGGPPTGGPSAGGSAAPSTPTPAPPAKPKSTKSAVSSTGRTAPTIGGGLPTGPGIVYFRVRTAPVCPGADDPDGRPVTVEWKVSGVSTVTIAIDGTGVYDTYVAATGRATFAFPCSGAAGRTQKHTYLLATAGETARKTKKITVSATVGAR